MTPTEQAEAIADKCTDAIIEAPEAKHTQDIIRDTCCLVEFFEVARAARELVGGPHRHIESCNCEHCALLKALAALRKKLPKGTL